MDAHRQAINNSTFQNERDVGKAIVSDWTINYSKKHTGKTSINSLHEHIKSVFRMDPLPVRGYDKVCPVVLLSVLLYQILVYFNCKMQKDIPKAIKYMIGC